MDDQLERYFEDIHSAVKASNSIPNQLKLIGLTSLFLSQLVSSVRNVENYKAGDKTNKYIDSAIDYMYKNYSRQIKISDIANDLSINRKYLSRIFKNHLNKSPQEILIALRIRKACELLMETHLSISDISRSVGYEDPVLFSKMFKKLQGSSPLQFKKRRNRIT
jgi:YesN/AraC family two-component response regulator